MEDASITLKIRKKNSNRKISLKRCLFFSFSKIFLTKYIKMPAVLEDHGIRDVWASNMEEELRNISRVVKTHRYIAMDTEFPGVVARPIGEFRSTQEYTYHQMKCNVNLLKIIQIGFTFFDDDGNRAQPISTWQFNFKFCLGDDMYAQESIELLRKSGIQFERHERDGMDPFDFAAELIGAGVVLQPNVFLSFH
ncbi:CCR4-NOT transcription complex subunit 8, partial [Bulinus truncatus]